MPENGQRKSTMAKVDEAVQAQRAIARVEGSLACGHTDSLCRYLSGHGHTQVQGWVTEGALFATLCFAGYQAEKAVEGSAIEIGVHHGRFFIALAAMVPEGTPCLAIDVFENQEANIDHSGKGDSTVFARNVREWLGDTRALRLLHADSRCLTAEAIVAAADGIRARLFSVDGGHTARYLVNDLCLAEKSITSEGLIIVDDFFNPAWPGVAEGVYRYLDRPLGRLEPVAYGDNKLYMALPGAAARYRTFVANALVPRAQASKLVKVGATEVFHIRLPSVSALTPLPVDEDGR